MSLVLGMLLDAIFGEPRVIWSRVPHPAVLMGQAVGWCDTRFNGGEMRQIKGVMVLLVLVIASAVLGWMLSALGWVVEALVVAVLLAQKSLVDHVQAVSQGLRMSLADGRRAVAMIVGRDTGELDQAAVSRAAIESAAENFSDGVLAPVFWFMVAGLPGLLVYKITNTADSMIGYRTERHEAFGWAAARFDDLLNLIPARLTALLMVLIHRRWDDWREIVREARQHRSPNAGWPEAALARVLDVALSGPRSYEGEMRDFAWVNGSGNRDSGPREIEAACRALWQVWAGLLGVAMMMWVFALV
ncbi:adenosylcobinamide-phosphate synthase CbiB [Alisedimentitalea sp. MJ-SS2]|uniref:adenosylcobinamide-phosphate synthase CbiB n=1 Tax=Aliisedimentitalea sp. MJ-SS2 TaxID=3049795 RepID=UPI0029066418|nr:adenosylcobinamide-phosphate synthase CbiB [Alisedimentitalea sp. MJ-SS2]MDU8929522.1 adenosylcobinamide-phosphate synthase CbiB [Alisedimentitalea sp. MJ-SS2]